MSNDSSDHDQLRLRAAFAEVQAIVRDYARISAELLTMRGELAELKRDAARIERDAKRYRYLREGHDDLMVVSAMGTRTLPGCLLCITHDALDMTIDMAIDRESTT